MRKKKKKNNPEVFWRAFTLAFIWTLAVLCLVFFTFNYGVNVAASEISKEKVKDNVRALIAARNHAWSNYLNELRSKVEVYLRKNISILAKANNAGSDGLVADGINFISDDRALVFYTSGKNNDHYLAEIVFGESSDPVRIERFILKIKNNDDYSNGVYGAD